MLYDQTLQGTQKKERGTIAAALSHTNKNTTPEQRISVSFIQSKVQPCTVCLQLEG